MKRLPSLEPIPALAALLLSLLLAACGGSGGSSSHLSGFPAVTLTRIASGFAQPLGIVHAGDGSGRLFILEQAGRVRILRDGAVVPAPFLDISDRVLAGGERGLLGLAFPPGFAGKGHFYVDYTRVPDGATVVSRFRLSPDPDAALATGEEGLLLIDQPFANHNAGQLAFGPDGFLYVALGDGGSGGDPFGNGQNRGTLLGNILRIDVESGVAPYAVPPGNPFVQEPAARGEIWAFGLRNPWRFSFDGDLLYVADVGQNTREEVSLVDIGSGGANLGWPVLEGTYCFAGPESLCQDNDFVDPIYEYENAGGRCSITGGYVYRGVRFPELAGAYFFSDYCSGEIMALRVDDGEVTESRVFPEAVRLLSSFGVDGDGEVYVTTFTGGAVYRLELDR